MMITRRRQHWGTAAIFAVFGLAVALMLASWMVGCADLDSRITARADVDTELEAFTNRMENVEAKAEATGNKVDEIDAQVVEMAQVKLVTEADVEATVEASLAKFEGELNASLEAAVLKVTKEQRISPESTAGPAGRDSKSEQTTTTGITGDSLVWLLGIGGLIMILVVIVFLVSFRKILKTVESHGYNPKNWAKKKANGVS